MAQKVGERLGKCALLFGSLQTRAMNEFAMPVGQDFTPLLIARK
jgi:hypothetical protein